MNKEKEGTTPLKAIDKALNGSANILIYALIAILALVIITCIVPVFFLDMSRLLKFSSETGPMGDTIGGTLGPFIAVIAAGLTFAAFWVQYDANRQQRKDLAVERFENQFFEMLRLHKENINELTIEGYDFIKSSKSGNNGNGYSAYEDTVERITKKITGRAVFLSAYYELKWCYNLCKDALKDQVIPDKERYLIKISYRLFFMGANIDLVETVVKDFSDDKAMIEICMKKLKATRLTWIQNLEKLTTNPQDVRRADTDNSIDYLPFSGHVRTWGHYFRHLYLMVRFIDRQPVYLIGYKEKREYLRLLRAQVSSHEQLMLYYNYLSGYGENWENKSNKFFSKYRMIHNLPFDLTKFSIDPHAEFMEEITAIKLEDEEMFEYDE